MEQQGERYLKAWRALGNILSDGGSWSGHERNCCFLNTRGERFADVSSAVGFDHDSDGRGVALVDWDHDGDLDVWTSNRTSPRMRYLENNGEARAFMQFRLQGSKSNRDAIGARLTLVTEPKDGREQKQIQTLRAGEGFLSQSSKRLHFGLGDAKPTRLEVHWPSGKKQSFDDLQPNERYQIKEGDDELQPMPTSFRRNVQLAEVEPPAVVTSPNLRIASSRRLPMPQLQLINAAGQEESLNFNAAKYTLLTLWASWCQPCVEELEQLQENGGQLKTAGVRWLPVSVDELKSEDNAKRWETANGLLRQIKVDTENMLATKAAVECLDVVQKSLTSKKSPLPVPCSFLLDSNGKLIVVYKGTVTSEQVVRDVDLQEQHLDNVRVRAVPFPGRWVMNTFPPDLMSVAESLRDIGRVEESLQYMLTHIPTKNFSPPITQETLTLAYLDLGEAFIDSRSWKHAERAVSQAVKVDPNNTRARLALGELYLRQGRKADATKQYRALLDMSPKQPMALNNLSWILASSKDDSLRDPKSAVAFAERLCELTQHSEPVSLDTYAVALAADGQFEKAVETLNNAIELAKKVGKPTDGMEKRLKLFEAKNAYAE